MYYVDIRVDDPKQERSEPLVGKIIEVLNRESVLYSVSGSPSSTRITIESVAALETPEEETTQEAAEGGFFSSASDD